MDSIEKNEMQSLFSIIYNQNDLVWSLELGGWDTGISQGTSMWGQERKGWEGG